MGEQVAAGFLYGGVAQLGEHLPCKQGVKGSNPSISTIAMNGMTWLLPYKRFFVYMGL